MKKIMLIMLSLLFGGGILFAGGQQEEPKKEEAVKAEETKTVESSVAPEISSPVTVEFWHGMSAKLGETVELLADEFNKTVGAEKGITVVPVFQGGYTDLKQKLTASIKAGTAPVISQGYSNYIAEFMQAEVVVDLNPYIYDSKVGIENFEDIFPGYRAENCQLDGKTFYSLPFNKSTEVIFYNKTFFEENGYEVPKTWDEMAALCKTIYEKTGKPGMGYDSLDNYMITMIQQYGGKYTDAQGHIYYSQNDAAVKAINLYKESFDKGYWRIAGEDKYLSGPFGNGDVFMYIGSTAGASYIKPNGFEWDSAPIPCVSSDKKAAIQQGTNVFLMNQNKSDTEVYAGYEFIKYLVSKDANFIWATNTGYLPIRKSVVESSEYKEYLDTTTDTTKVSGPAQGDYYFYEPGFFTPNYSSYDVRVSLRTALEDVLLNGTDAKAAVDAAYSKLQ